MGRVRPDGREGSFIPNAGDTVGSRSVEVGTRPANEPQQQRISNKMALTLTLSRPTGEGTAGSATCRFPSAWLRRPTEDDAPSPIRWERGGVRVSVPQNPKLFLHESLRPRLPFVNSPWQT